MKVYFDNDVVSSISRRDRDKVELDAIDQLVEWNRSCTIVVETSRHSLREMERAPSQHQANLKSGMSELGMVEDDHRLFGFHTQTDQYGGYSRSPLISDIVDEQLFSKLLTAGLKKDDAQHLMYAVQNRCDRFLTFDGGILSRRVSLEKCCPSIKIQKPSELVNELSISPQI